MFLANSDFILRLFPNLRMGSSTILGHPLLVVFILLLLQPVLCYAWAHTGYYGIFLDNERPKQAHSKSSTSSSRGNVVFNPAYRCVSCPLRSLAPYMILFPQLPYFTIVSSVFCRNLSDHGRRYVASTLYQLSSDIGYAVILMTRTYALYDRSRLILALTIGVAVGAIVFGTV